MAWLHTQRLEGFQGKAATFWCEISSFNFLPPFPKPLTDQILNTTSTVLPLLLKLTDLHNSLTSAIPRP